MNEELSPEKLFPAVCAESEGKYRDLFESSRDALMTLEPPSWKFTSANPATVKMFGAKNEEEFISHGPWELSPERQPDGRDSGQKAKEMIETALREGSHFFEWTHRRIGGQEFSADVLLTRMERGGKAILQATVRDITERKNAQAAAEESERRYRLLIEQSVDGIIVADGRWDIQFVNPAICRMLGYTPEELCQLNIAETGIPEERDKVARQRQALRAGSIVRYERNIRKKDGSCFPVEVIIGQMDDGRYQEIVRDITERKRTQEALQKREAHYRALVETTHTGFVVVDHEGKVLDANAEYVRLTGHRDLNEIRGRSVLEWTAAHEKEKNAEAVKRCLEQGYIRNLEIDYVDCHGNIIPVEINATVVKTGEMLQILTLCRDITERRRADQALRTSEERYRGLFETMQEGFALCEIICDAAGQACDFRYLEANAAFDKMFGIKCDEVLGKTVREVFPQIDGYWIDILGKVALTGGHADFEGYLRAADKHFEVAAFCPQPGLFAAIFTDITDRKRAEEQLRLQSTALEAAANSIIITDSHGIILWVNPAFSSLTGWSRKEVVGKTPRILKSDKQDISFYRGLWGTITAGRVWHGEMINRRKDGSLYTKEMTVTPVRNEHGAIINFVAIDQDITERRRAEEALSASSAYSRSLIEASLDPLVTIGPEGKITDVNAASETATGRKRTELIGTDFSAYFTDPEKARAGYQQAFREGSVRDYPLELRHRDGSVISVLYNATVYRDAAGNVVGVFAAARDITERKRAEEIVRRASAYNRSLLEASLDPLVTIGPDGKITDVNQATELVTGVAREQLIGTNFSDYFTEPERANTGYQQVLREGLVRDYPLTIRHISGRATDVLYNATVYRNEAGEVQGVFAAARDITERKRAEAAMQRMVAIVESSDDAIIGKTLDGIITSWNSGAEKLFGYSAEEIVGKPILALIPPEYLKEEADIVERLKRGESINHFETVRVRKGGQRIDISLTVSPIRDSHGRIIGASKIARDITERKRSEEALQESNRRLQEALDDLNAAQDRVIQQERLSALGAMASGIAHDFNNSLTAILGGSELLLQRPEYLDDKEKTRNYVEMMNTAAQDAGRVVNRLREFYRPREKDEAFAAVNINEVVRQAIALTEPKWKAEAEARSVSVTVHADLQEVPLIDGNATELREALTNLIFNAVDAMPSGGTITIHTYRDDGQVVVQVADTGTGMTEEVRRRCLDPFFTTKGESGSGLGLSMVYGVLQRHQSTVDIETELGRGTTFIIRLPVQSAKPKSEPSATPASVAQQLHILVVDDEAVVRRIVGEYLKLDGHIVEVANSGHDGLEKFRNDRFDLVLVDRAMPDISGDQVATAIKSAEPKVAVVMLTGFGSMMEAADEKPTGVDFIVGKPVTINALRTAISKAVASVN